MDAGELNEQTAKIIIKELIHQGVRKFCIAPGSRSTPLATAAAEHPLAETHVHFDERGLGFYALGFAKAKNAPVAIIVTSGTAVANLLPAVIEASHSHIPLITLTADRPPELQDCGANQSIDQIGIFGSFVRWECDLPCPNSSIDENYWGSTLAQAVFQAKRAPSGPVHINCPFRKPFLSSKPLPKTALPSTKRISSTSQLLPKEDDLSAIADVLSPIENGIILVGASPNNPRVEALETLSRLLQWPIIADIDSGIRSKGEVHGLSRFYDLIFQSLPNHDEIRVDGVLHFGGPYVSMALGKWMAKHNPECYCHVVDTPSRLNPYHITTHAVEADPYLFASELAQYLPGRGPSNWMALFNSMGSVVEERIESFFSASSDVTEPGVIRLMNSLSPQTAVFVSNSMPIRDADSLFFPKHEAPLLFANRGASGIDGNIATACGICKALDRPTLAILGDQASLHDLNSLAQTQTLTQPFVILVINNGGGGIFSFLPIAEKQNFFETHVANAHNYHFKTIAQTFGLTYYLPKTIGSLSETLNDALDGNGPALIEVITDRKRNYDLHKEILGELAGLKTTTQKPVPVYANLQA